MSQSSATSESEEHGTRDLFTPEFKRLKARNPPPDFSTVVDLSQYDSSSSAVIDKRIIQCPVKCCHLKPVAGLKPCEEWKVFQFADYPDFILIQNPFLDGYQGYWTYRCLQSFPSDRDNVTNLTALGDERSRDLWQQFVRKKCDVLDKHDPLMKLRWTTLGYHYNWTTKEYSEDNRAPFPMDVNCLSQYFAACLGFADYQSQAAIVNYYHLDSTLAGHTDHSEVDQCAPLFSISFGQTAIFLLGGSTKSVKPMSVFLRSGDVSVMSGQCRLAYHAVPRILAPVSEEPLLSAFSLRHDRQHEDCDSITSELSSCGHHSDVKIYKSEDSSEMSGMTASVTSHLSVIDTLDRTHSQTEGCHNTGCVQRTPEGHMNMMNSDDRYQYNTSSGHFRDYDSYIDEVNSKIRKVVATIDFSPFHVYLKSSRINLNVRQVLPSGVTELQTNNLTHVQSSSNVQVESLCDKLIQEGVRNTLATSTSEIDSVFGASDKYVNDFVQKSEKAGACSGIADTKKMKMDVLFS